MEKMENLENIESQIERLLKELDNFCLDMFPEEIQEELENDWYEAEMEAEVGEDREQALKHLQWFLDKLAKTPKKE